MKQKKKTLTADIVPDCYEGEYRSIDMTSCQECPAGHEPNDDQDDCGKHT